MLFEGFRECVDVLVVSIPNESERAICEFEMDFKKNLFVGVQVLVN